MHDITWIFYAGFIYLVLVAAFVNIRAFFILGSIYDDINTIRQTMDFAKELNPDLAQFSYFVP